MAKLLRVIIICNVIYVIVRLLILHSSVTWKHFVGLLVTSAAYALSYKQLAQMAEPSYDDDGDLLDGGYDMSTGGICSIHASSIVFIIGPLKCYLHDVIYITSFVQVMSILSGKFWYTYLVIPAFAAYKLSGLAKGFLSHDSDGVPEDEKSRKKREKLEKKASRPKFVKTRSK
ncbi:hypothetical protein MKW98_028379 [Papaver atlanticum]|uniref:Transmembrane protein n=1 Tax=Papaver atlanticum TaxID=357466 RepID=A0AAD4XLZ3_9MAGN|nr:hypothetical protein MKW98_028379 [Papaver atlanticum]